MTSLATSSGELLVFLDERVEDSKENQRIIVGLIAIGAKQWASVVPQARQVSQIKKKNRLVKIQELLETGQGFAVVGYCDYPKGLIIKDAYIVLPDVPKMSRFDCAWSVLVLFAIATAMAEEAKSAAHANGGLTGISLYYDRKGLTAKHRNALYRYVKRKFPDLVGAVRPSGSLPPTIWIGQVKKCTHNPTGEEMDKFHVGTMLVDRLLEQSKRVISGMMTTERILVHNFSDDAIAQVEEFVEATKVRRAGNAEE